MKIVNRIYREMKNMPNSSLILRTIIAALILCAYFIWKSCHEQDKLKNRFMKKAISLLIIGICFYIGGLITNPGAADINNLSKNKNEVIEKKVQRSENYKAVGITLGILGSIWIIVSYLQGRKK